MHTPVIEDRGDDGMQAEDIMDLLGASGVPRSSSSVTMWSTLEAMVEQQNFGEKYEEGDAMMMVLDGQLQASRCNGTYWCVSTADQKEQASAVVCADSRSGSVLTFRVSGQELFRVADAGHGDRRSR